MTTDKNSYMLDGAVLIKGKSYLNAATDAKLISEGWLFVVLPNGKVILQK